MIKQLGLLGLLILTFSCKKEMTNGPVNFVENNSSNSELNCSTCPTTLYPFSQTSSCDDLTSSNWPWANFSGGDTIGFTQNQTELVHVNPGGFAELNGGFPGLFFTGPIHFAFDGDEQIINIEVYGYLGQYDQYGFTVNGSTVSYLDGSFPMTIGGVNVELDTSIVDVVGFESANLRFTGEVSTIEFEGFESGITEVCVSHIASIPNNPAFEAIRFVDFIDDSGVITGSHPTAKTPLGYYGLQATSMEVDFNKFLGYKPKKISFVHSHFVTAPNLLNVQLPGTPLIVASPNELQALLSNYGYQTEVYTISNGLMWIDEFSLPITGMQVDSIVIRGDDISKVQIGANLVEAELRSICSFY